MHNCQLKIFDVVDPSMFWDTFWGPWDFQFFCIFIGFPIDFNWKRTFIHFPGMCQIPSKCPGNTSKCVPTPFLQISPKRGTVIQFVPTVLYFATPEGWFRRSHPQRPRRFATTNTTQLDCTFGRSHWQRPAWKSSQQWTNRWAHRHHRHHGDGPPEVRSRAVRTISGAHSRDADGGPVHFTRPPRGGCI